jgi:hypothetical protein
MWGSQHGRGGGDVGAKGFDAAPAQRLGAALGDDEGALPVAAAVDRDDEMPGRDSRQAVVGLRRVARDAKPEHVDRRADVLDRQPGGGAHRRMATVAADDAAGADLELAVVGAAANAGDAPALLDQPGDVGAHPQRECRQLLRLAGDEVEELPLRHHGDEGVARRQAAEVAELDVRLAEPAADPVEPLVRPLQEGVEQAELVHDPQRRRVDGVATEIAQEVAVLLEHLRANAGAREQVAEHHPGRSPADDAAGGVGIGESCVAHRDSSRISPGAGGRCD